MPMQLSAAPHAAESHFREALVGAGGPGHVIDDARAAGIPWATIFQLLVQYGPQAWAVLQKILDALKTPAP
jgi:hypothetical protein